MTESKRVILYRDSTGREPLADWLNRLRDARTRRRILQRLARLQSGHYGDYRLLRKGVYELRLDFGPGFRVYFGEDRNTIVVLLCGGDKSSQRRDIERAENYWTEYRKHG